MNEADAARLTRKTLYIFAFYTFYQFFARYSPSKSGLRFRAGIVLTTMFLWILFAVLLGVDLVRHSTYLPPVPFLLLLGAAYTVLDYAVVPRHDRWKEYVHEFEHWPARTLRIGRSLVWLGLAGSFVSFILVLRQYQLEYRTFR